MLVWRRLSGRSVSSSQAAGCAGELPSSVGATVPLGQIGRPAFGLSTELFVEPVGKTQSPRRYRRMATAISGRFELSAPD